MPPSFFPLFPCSPCSSRTSLLGAPGHATRIPAPQPLHLLLPLPGPPSSSLCTPLSHLPCMSVHMSPPQGTLSRPLSLIECHCHHSVPVHSSVFFFIVFDSTGIYIFMCLLACALPPHLECKPPKGRTSVCLCHFCIRSTWTRSWRVVIKSICQQVKELIHTACLKARKLYFFLM